MPRTWEQYRIAFPYREYPFNVRGALSQKCPALFLPSVRKKLFSEGILSIQCLFLQRPRPGFTTLPEKGIGGENHINGFPRRFDKAKTAPYFSSTVGN